MIFSRTSKYAVQALIYIATKPRGELVLGREIAEYIDAPLPYLHKILQIFCRGNLLDSYRGRPGGFCLREGMENLDLMQILMFTQSPGFSQACILGLKVCSGETACPVHLQWAPIKERIVALLHEQTLEKLARAVLSGQYRLTDLPHAMMR